MDKDAIKQSLFVKSDRAITFYSTVKETEQPLSGRFTNLWRAQIVSISRQSTGELYVLLSLQPPQYVPIETEVAILTGWKLSV